MKRKIVNGKIKLKIKLKSYRRTYEKIKRNKNMFLIFFAIISLLSISLINSFINITEKSNATRNELDSESIASKKTKPIQMIIEDEVKNIKLEDYKLGKDDIYVKLEELDSIIDCKISWKSFLNTGIIEKDDRELKIDMAEKTKTNYRNEKEDIEVKGDKVSLKGILEEYDKKLINISEYGIFRIASNNSDKLNIELLKNHEANLGIKIENYTLRYEKEKYEFEKNNPEKIMKVNMKEVPKEKVAYLTFDDGPNEHTLDIVDILNSYNIKGTFFTLGTNVSGNEETVRKVYESGHNIGLHGMTHRYKQVYSSPLSFLDEMEQNNNLIEPIIGVRSKLIRAPYGSKPGLSENFRNLLYENNYRFWDWNVDSQDAIGNKTPKQVEMVTKRQIDSLEGKPLVMLFHDRIGTKGSLASIIEYLQERGYRFEMITEDIYPLNFWNDIRILN